jgi:hypothetical protein
MVDRLRSDAKLSPAQWPQKHVDSGRTSRRSVKHLRRRLELSAD